jgi:penicillin-binding protein 1C
MLANDMISQQEHDAALQQKLVVKRYPRPFVAPHFSDLVLDLPRTTDGEIQTTLNRDLQRRVEQTLAMRIPHYREQGIDNGAVVVLDVETGDVLAMVGSFDYSDAKYAGMYNHALALRSPGSALKPFIYAMALDQGMITPGSLLRDAPIHFRDTTPQNFDLDFRGNVSAREALIQSLNMPAIRVLGKVGGQETLDTLHRLGLDTLDGSVEDYGFTLAIGGCEVALLDVVTAYACLARGGEYLPYRLVRDDTHREMQTMRIFSEEASFMVSDMLGGEERSMDMFGHIGDAALPRVAWKTGTSSGFRDAWTIAWNAKYVIGVWLGNSDGSGSRALIGAKVAAPLVGDLVRTVVNSETDTWITVPSGLARREGQDGLQEWYIPSISLPVAQREEQETLRIAAPVDGTIYHLLADTHLTQELKIEPEGVDGELHWFVDGSFVARTQGGEALRWELKQGEHTFVCVDEAGASATTRILVQR